MTMPYSPGRALFEGNGTATDFSFFLQSLGNGTTDRHPDRPRRQQPPGQRLDRPPERRRRQRDLSPRRRSPCPRAGNWPSPATCLLNSRSTWCPDPLRCRSHRDRPRPGHGRTPAAAGTAPAGGHPAPPPATRRPSRWPNSSCRRERPPKPAPQLPRTANPQQRPALRSPQPAHRPQLPRQKPPTKAGQRQPPVPPTPPQSATAARQSAEARQGARQGRPERRVHPGIAGGGGHARSRTARRRRL